MGGGLIPALAEDAGKCAERVCEADAVLLMSHIDADGLTSAAIATITLRRAGIPVETGFAKQLDESVIEEIAATEYETVLFTDFGSGQIEVIVEYEDSFTPVILDHHQPGDAETTYHLNPLLVGIDGSTELSGAGTTYTFARSLGENQDLAGLAVVGAVGDMQASNGALTGANTVIVAEGTDAGVIETGRGLALYGKQTRPLPKLLEYATDVSIPGLTNNESGCIRFLTDLGIELQEDGEWLTWADLPHEERRTIVSGLVQRAVEKGVPADRIDALIGTTYELADEAIGSELRDASEFSTLLNATARYDRPDVGLVVCLGDRGAGLAKARQLLVNHRRNLSEGLDLVRSEGVVREQHIQWFDAGDRIKETIVGIVAGMAIGTDGVDSDRPIIAFADADDGIKVSSRGTPMLVRRGLDLSRVMREAARGVGGDGGGHDIAAGATIPRGATDKFIERVDALAGEQL